MGTFCLTDFLVRQFDTIVWKGPGLDRHPELRDMYFGIATGGCIWRRPTMQSSTGRRSGRWSDWDWPIAAGLRGMGDLRHSCRAQAQRDQIIRLSG